MYSRFNTGGSFSAQEILALTIIVVITVSYEVLTCLFFPFFHLNLVRYYPMLIRYTDATGRKIPFVFFGERDKSVIIGTEPVNDQFNRFHVTALCILGMTK